MDQGLRETVRQRAGTRVSIVGYPKRRRLSIAFHVEHIVSRQHGGGDDPAGLALACDRFNAYKGPNIASVDPETGTVVALFIHVPTCGAITSQSMVGTSLASLRLDAQRRACSI